jgi:hypothetical protein
MSRGSLCYTGHSPFKHSQASFPAMTRITRFLPAIVATVLSACGGTMVSDYARVPVTDFRVAGENWTVSDMTYQSRMLVGPDTGDFSDGMLRSYNPADRKIPPERYEAVAAAWLKQNHRGQCVIEDDYMLDWPRFEVVYSCGENELQMARPAGALPGPSPQQTTLALPFAPAPGTTQGSSAPGTLPPYQGGESMPAMSGAQPGTLPPYQSAPQQQPVPRPTDAKPWDNFPK